MENRFFAPTKGKDGMFYLRVVSSQEDELGIVTDKTGFLKFADGQKADNVYKMLEQNELGVEIGEELPGNLYKITAHKVEQEVA